MASHAPADGQGLLSSLITKHSSKQLAAEHIGLYYDFNKALVPEAFRPFHQAFYSPRPAKLQRRGAGKSIAVVQLVEWARNNGWLALYIPAAVELTRGGFFYKRDDGTYDTIISAQHILKSFADSHEKQLSGYKLQLPESLQLLQSPAAAAAVGGATGSAAVSEGRDSLRDLVMTGLSTDDNARLAVDCCLLLVKELAALSASVPVLLAVDGYNVLHWRSDYGRTISRSPRGKPAYQYRQELPVHKLNLARGFRLLQRDDLAQCGVLVADRPCFAAANVAFVLEMQARGFRLLQRDDLAQCRVLVADSASGAVPADLAVPSKAAADYHMPRFSPVETAHALFYYHERGLVPAPPSQQQVAAMRALTNGSGEELRRWSVSITQTGMGLL
ncbi:hypothetical protein OEZ86_005486 [Tetradesmus obliquus]|nr:hypothetical protein OEZ86_005486 [Tetradesmus obliquus]